MTHWSERFNWQDPTLNQQEVEQCYQTIMDTERRRFMDALLPSDQRLIQTLAQRPEIWQAPMVYEQILTWVRQRRLQPQGSVQALAAFLTKGCQPYWQNEGFGVYGEPLEPGACAPHVGRVLIDGCSPHVTLPYAPGQLASAYDGPHLQALEQRLHQARATMLADQPGAWHFIEANCTVLVLRKSNSGAITSSSQSQFLGRITLDNFHVQGISDAKLEGDLLHEAMHNYLYKVELVGRFIADNAYLTEQLDSPWTGNRICLHSFVHACFIWASLFRYWQGRAKQDPDQQQLMALAQGGFCNGGVARLLSRYQGVLTQPVVQAIEQLCHSFQTR